MKNLKLHPIIMGAFLTVVTPSHSMQQPPTQPNGNNLSTQILSGLGYGAAVVGRGIADAGYSVGTTIAQQTIGHAPVFKWQAAHNNFNENPMNNSHELDYAIKEVERSQQRVNLVTHNDMLDLLEAAKKTIEKKPGTLHVSDDAKFIALPYMTRYHAELSKELERVATIITFLNTTPRTSMEIPSAAKAEEPILINDYIPPIIAAPNTDDAQENDTNLDDTKSSMRTVGSTESLTSSASNANPSTPATLDGSKKKKKKKKPGAKQNDDDNDGDET
jgi:hypothetical protein